MSGEVNGPREEMCDRLTDFLTVAIPELDLDDATSMQSRQFAPEYSQNIYQFMLSQEFAIGHYLKDGGQTVLQISEEQRKRMVLLIEDLVHQKNWKLETMFSAVSIADQYLSSLIPRNEVSPCLVQLGLTCLLLASKLEEPRQPRIDCYILYIAKKYDVNLLKRDVLAQEMRILKALDFNIRFTTPLFFLERFQRIFDLDLEAEDPAAKHVGTWARKFCRFMLLHSHFLCFRPT